MCIPSSSVSTVSFLFFERAEYPFFGMTMKRPKKMDIERSLRATPYVKSMRQEDRSYEMRNERNLKVTSRDVGFGRYFKDGLDWSVEKE